MYHIYCKYNLLYIACIIYTFILYKYRTHPKVSLSGDFVLIGES